MVVSIVMYERLNHVLLCVWIPLTMATWQEMAIIPVYEHLRVRRKLRSIKHQSIFASLC